MPRTSTRPNPAPSRWRTHRPPSPLCLLPAPTTTQHRPALPFYTARPKPSIKCSVSGLWSNPRPPKPCVGECVGPPSLRGLSPTPTTTQHRPPLPLHTARPKHAPEQHERTWTNEPVQPRMAGAPRENGEGGGMQRGGDERGNQWVWTVVNERGKAGEREQWTRVGER